MKTYISPSTDIVVLSTQERFLQDYQGHPQGSYTVDPLPEKDPITIGGDDENVNAYNVSLWDED